jgi:transposase InsO family protein
MPFQETCVLAERIALFRDYETGAFSVSELARRYGVSRETIYVWKRRWSSGDERWFDERSHVPDVCPHQTADATGGSVIAVRRRFPHFGPKKIKAWLERHDPDVAWPAASTMGDILKRAGLVEPHRRVRRPVSQGSIAPGDLKPNAEWSTDFKGWFRTRDGARCDPLTITDTASRYLIGTVIVRPTYIGVRGAFEQIFEAFGLPDAIRSDNGSPFGSTGAGGLSSLAVWWLRLGIEPHYVRPASPQENGRHERMHRTLKAETTRPPAATIQEQQTRFDTFRQHYNEQRPHEALDQTPPTQHWMPSRRSFPRRLEEPWYDADHEVRRVRHQGDIKWRGEHVFIGEALAGQLIGIAENDNGGHQVRFCTRDLGVIDHAGRFRRFAPPHARLHVHTQTDGDSGTDRE